MTQHYYKNRFLTLLAFSPCRPCKLSSVPRFIIFSSQHSNTFNDNQEPDFQETAHLVVALVFITKQVILRKPMAPKSPHKLHSNWFTFPWHQSPNTHCHIYFGVTIVNLGFILDLHVKLLKTCVPMSSPRNYESAILRRRGSSDLNVSD